MTIAAKWNLGQTEISLFRAEERLKFSVKTDGVVTREEDFSSERYDISYALNLIRIFHDVIQGNLSREVGAASFLPVLCRGDVWTLRDGQYVPITGVRIALFGLARSCEGVWGIFQEASATVERFDDVSGEVRDFLSWVPRQDCQENNYAVTAYANKCKIVLTYDLENRIQFVLLKRMSFFDRELELNEQHWAVTVLSSKGCSGLIESLDCGHAMIACEGVQDNRQFLKYVHITTRHEDPDHPDLNRKPDEARVAILRESVPLYKALYGPTWPRPRCAVENMLRPIEEARDKKRYVQFAMYRDVPVAVVPVAAAVEIASAVVSGVWCGMAVVGALTNPALSALSVLRVASIAYAKYCTVSTLAATMHGRLHRSALVVQIEDKNHCLSWSLAQLPRAGIYLSLPSNVVVMTPHQLVECLRSNPSAVIFDEFAGE